MLESLLVRHGAPTLAGLKTGTLFSCPFADRQEMLCALLHWNRRLSPKGLRLLPLARHRGRTLVYLYRPLALSRDLRRPQIRAVLQAKDYPCQSPERCILHLRHKLDSCREFPHEIGLFLGYPPEDVLGFMNDPTGCKLAGLWKVYGDVPAARLRFAQYRACARLYSQCLGLGIPPDQLAFPD